MRKALTIVLFLLILVNTKAQRPMDRLDRGVVALKTSAGVYINWRIPAEEYYNVSYNIYRDGTKLNTDPITGASNFTDASGTISSTYTVTSVKNGAESIHSKVTAVLNTPYWNVAMRTLPDAQHYELNDATAADLDGDGEYEIIVKRLNKDFENLTTTWFTFFEAYKLDGTLLWAIDVGPNIINDVEINIMAYDFDGDGKAEVVMRSSEGTIDGKGNKIGDTNADGVTNYRSVGIRINNSPYMIKGPEFLSLYNGETGEELDRVDFIAREPLSQWGDASMNEGQLAHRSNKFFFGAPFLDGKKPSVFIGRGIYHRTKFETYDIVNKKFQSRWSFDSGSGAYSGQGNHNFTIADIDEDGRDEITWGSMCVDDNGQGLYSTGMGHGDAIHVGDFDPYHKGIEVFTCLENSPVFGTLLREGATGKILHHYVKGSDCGRCCAGNITDSYKGAEIWGGGYGYSATNRVAMNNFGVAENYTIYWDGDLLKELCDHRGFTTTNGVGYGTISKFKGYGNVVNLLEADAYSCNWSKGTPCLQADLMGDWREEVIWRSTDNKSLRIYVTPYETQHRIYTLMHDHQYRQAIAWQMCGYNQPPHVSYFLGDTYTTPPPAQSTNNKLVWKGTSQIWDKTSANWLKNDTATTFSDGKEVLLDVSASNLTIILNENVSPEVLTVSAPVDFSIEGTGQLTGTTRLNKMGSGSLTLMGKHTYTGPTEVWAGNLTINDTLESSSVWLNRFTTLTAKSYIPQGITMEFGSVLYPGGDSIADTLFIGNLLDLKEGSVLNMDLSKYPSAIALANQNDFIKINGNLNLGSNLILNICLPDTTISEGDYIIAEVSGLITGAVTNFTVKGIVGKKMVMVQEGTKIILRITGVRDATSVIWKGNVSNAWDVSITSNWLKEGFSDIFVYQDSVLFNDEGTSKNIIITGSPAPSHLNLDNTTASIYTFDGTGDISGSGMLHKTNTGVVFINNRNSFTGKTIIDGGRLTVKYAPTSTNNGGFGTNDTDPANLIISNNAILQLNTANEITDRGLTLGTGGGIIENASKLTWNGTIKGTKLTKQGAGILIIGNSNSNLDQTVLNAGTVYLGTESAITYGPGKNVIFNGGTLELLNSTNGSSTCSFNLNVPTGITGKLIMDGRCEYNGTLTGGGTLNLLIDYVRGNLNGNWSNFTGIINVSENPYGSSTYSNDFRINNTYGYANATINFGANVTAYHTGTAVVKVGMLTGSATSYINDNDSWEVGSLGTNGTFAGAISTSGSITKKGTGNWTLSGANTYTGSTFVSEGTLILSGTKSGTGSVSVLNGATLNVSGTVAGTVSINNGGNLSLSGTLSSTLLNYGTLTGTGKVNGAAILYANSTVQPAGASLVGTLTFVNNLTVQSGAVLDMQLLGTSSSDKLVISGTITCNGKLKVTQLSGTPVNGSEYQLLYATTTSGTFESIELPTLTEGLVWDTTELYISGKIKVTQTTTLPYIMEICEVLSNPTNGNFRIKYNKPIEVGAIQITNVKGIKITASAIEIEDNIIYIDISNETNGMYFVRIQGTNGKLDVLRLLKQ